MTQNPQSPELNPVELIAEPEGGPLARHEAFMQTRRAKPGQATLSRSEQLRQFRTIQGIHRPSLNANSKPQTTGRKKQSAQPSIVPIGPDTPIAVNPPDPGGVLTNPLVEDTSLLDAHWYPLGPSALQKGQAGNRPPVSGRVTSIAVAPGGQTVFSGSANGGIWRTDNAGLSWQPLMNALHYNPSHQMSDSLAIGAVIVDSENPDRVFVGSGEGPGSVQTKGAPEFFGIGPLFSRDGGQSWENESVTAFDVAVLGSAFFQLAMDPQDRDRIVGATREGLIVRQPRNQAVADPRKTTAYLWWANGSRLVNSYWDKAGTNLVKAGSGAGLTKGAILKGVTYKGLPYTLYYRVQTGPFELRLWRGDGSLFSLNKQAGPANWPANLLIMPFSIANRLLVVRYSPATGLASLAEFVITDNDYTVTDLWTDQNWGAGWTTLLPLTLVGRPYFIAYNTNTGQSTLQRWLTNGLPKRVWLKVWPQGLSLMAFLIGANSYFMGLESQNGGGTVQRFFDDGTYEEVSRMPATTFPQKKLQLSAFNFGNTVRFIAYDKTAGDALLFEFNSNIAPQQIWWQRWSTGLSVGTFDLGFEWAAATVNPPPPPNSQATSVVVTQKGSRTTFFAAFKNVGVYQSLDSGLTWSVLHASFPANTQRISLAVKADDPDVVYAFVADGRVLRFQAGDKWRAISGVPDERTLLNGQGFYDLAIAVSPSDVNMLYLGGAGQITSGEWVASIYRCIISIPLIFGNPSMVPTQIGFAVHADIHAFAFVDGDPDQLWVGCDGGMFHTRRARDSQNLNHLFQARNCGLATLTVNAVGQHPFEDAILYCGSQDNGGGFMTGGDGWTLGSFGDGGDVLTWWKTTNDSRGWVIYNYTNNRYNLSKNGADNTSQFTVRDAGTEATPSLFYPPYAQFPELATQVTAPRIGFGSTRPWLNDTFGSPANGWVPIGADLGAKIVSMVFASANQFYVGLTNGQVYRYTFGGPNWNPGVRLDNQGGNVFADPIMGIVVDPHDANRIFVCLGGAASTYQKVWFFDGVNWAARSGPAAGDPNSIITLQYNTLVGSLLGNTDPDAPIHLFLGGDLGVWHSWDGGLHWQTLSEALPESAVFDLKLFPADATLKRPWLLRAATYGRSIYERVLTDATPTLQESLKLPVQLFLCASNLDRGLYPAKTRLNQIDTGEADIRSSIDLKILKSADGLFPDPPVVDFCEYTEIIGQDFNLNKPTTGRVYVRVHQRGFVIADRVKVRLFLTRAGATAEPLNTAPAIPNLPGNIDAAVNFDQVATGPDWIDLGSQFLDGLQPGVPLIVSQDFPLTQKGSYYLMAILTQDLDPFESAPVKTKTLDLVTLNRKVAIHYFIVEWP